MAKERLLWGFWSKEVGRRLRENWASFIRLYNKIKPFDIVVFQIAQTGKIHALGIVKGTYYDDQTPIWPEEKNRVLFPWKVCFSSLIFSRKPFTLLFTKGESYVEGYGIGELPEHEFRKILTEVQKQLNQLNMDINLG